MVKIYEGAWGVTLDGRIFGPMAEDQDALSEYFPWRCGTHSWGNSGCFSDEPSDLDIVAVFPTRETAEASLAKKTHDPRQDAITMPPAPKPVTWPNGVKEMTLDSGTVVKICNGDTRVWLICSDGAYNDDAIRELAALIVAAADYIKEGKE